MLLGLFLWLCEVALTLTKAKEFVPQPMDSNQESFDRSLTHNVFSGKRKDEMPDFKINKTVFWKGSQLHSWDSELTHFQNSQTILLLRRGKVHISFDNGDKWSIVDEIQEHIDSIVIDKFHEERAIAYGQPRSYKHNNDGFNMYLTENRGQTWRKILLNLPDDVWWCSFSTHPFEKNYLLLNCGMRNSRNFREAAYISRDGGRNFSTILPPKEILSSLESSVYCDFAASSKDSNFAKESAYCIYSIAEDMTEENSIEIGLTNMTEGNASTDQRILFYTADMGRTTHAVEKLKDYSVLEMYILPACILITTEDTERSNNEVWISNDGGDFQKAMLPEEFDNFQFIGVTDAKVLGRTLLELQTSLHRDTQSALLTLDALGANLTSYNPFPDDALARAFIQNSKSHNGTLWGDFFFRLDSDNLQISKSKVSFDQGTTWSNLRVVDRLNNYSHLFGCDVRNTDDCSLQIDSDYEIPIYESSIGLVVTGFVGSNKTSGCFWERRRSQTFMSKDGGVTWEVLFDFPIKSLCSSSEDVLVALPSKELENEEESYSVCSHMTISSSEIYISRDRGQTWGNYTLGKSGISSPWTTTFQSSNSRVFFGVSEIDGFHAHDVLYTIDF
ncbi:ZYBA0S21-00232g1_1 [Zygosaccharomyces bailii CLIB 213]|uniref:ZYBA0S21-00232g1_1 n=1 Tax=Zygosaccharomyces bailii (strain CLIB 213 / ATCC 58445 / CBS 680 / BCRC 21525 / NBRC 1098 / NCYC 1416 / NRRL Y-2227) TaxID=1333698 RepID=A0A8J2XEU8_ZYGB2|nr:ZYBA0S21-00232g1_1 [Zygosaccharomyces bailii CLIB 213]